MEILSYLLGKKSGGGGGATLQNNKAVTISSNTSTEVSPDTGYDAMKKVTVTTNVQPNLESKSVTITTNGTTTVKPSQNKDGLSSVEITTNVSGGSVELDGKMKFAYSIFTELPSWLANASGWTNYTNTDNMFNSCPNMTTIPLIDISQSTTAKQMFNGCAKLTSVPLLNTGKVKNMSNMFASCSLLTTVPVFDTNKVTNFSSMFSYANSLSDSSLDNILQMCIGATSYTSTKKLSTLGISSSTYPNIQNLPHYQDFLDAGWTIS